MKLLYIAALFSVLALVPSPTCAGPLVPPKPMARPVVGATRTATRPVTRPGMHDEPDLPNGQKKPVAKPRMDPAEAAVLRSQLSRKAANFESQYNSMNQRSKTLDQAKMRIRSGTDRTAMLREVQSHIADSIPGAIFNNKDPAFLASLKQRSPQFYAIHEQQLDLQKRLKAIERLSDPKTPLSEISYNRMRAPYYGLKGELSFDLADGAARLGGSPQLREKLRTDAIQKMTDDLLSRHKRLVDQASGMLQDKMIESKTQLRQLPQEAMDQEAELDEAQDGEADYDSADDLDRFSPLRAFQKRRRGQVQVNVDVQA